MVGFSLPSLQNGPGTSAFSGAVTAGILYVLGKSPMDSLIYGAIAGGVFYIITMTTVPGFPGEWNTGIAWDYSKFGIQSTGRDTRLALTALAPLGYAWWIGADDYLKIAAAAVAGPVTAGAVIYSQPGNF